MADDDEGTEPVEEFEDEEAEPGELDGDIDEEDLDEEGDDFAEIDDDFSDGGDDEEDEEDEGDEPEESAGPARRSVGEDDDEDDELLTPDDVEADLDTILKDRLVTAEEDENDSEDEEPEDRAETGDRLQPKRADERLCPSCFLLVRNGAPMCPVGDDECPLFT